jgi:hypothetical protein
MALPIGQKPDATIHSPVATPNPLGQHVLQRCHELGFALAGVTEAAPSARAAELRAWIDAGHHGSMQYLACNLELREDVRRLLASLPPASRALAALLAEMSVTEAARALGLHRSTVYDRIASIRAVAVTLGMHEYILPGPTLSRSRR